MDDGNFTFRACISWVAIVLLLLMTYFCRKSKIKYLYLINIVFWIVAIGSHIILMGHQVWYNDPRLRMQAMPFIWLISRVMSIFLTIPSISVFLVMKAQKYLWAKVVIVIIKILSTVALIGFGYLFILGILSLKSG